MPIMVILKSLKIKNNYICELLLSTYIVFILDLKIEKNVRLFTTISML